MPSPKKNIGTNKGWSNLKPAKKGEPSRNPKGRPKKGSAISDILNKIGDKQYSNNITYREQMLTMAYKLAIAGDAAARNFIADRTEGKAIERVIKQKTDDILEIK